MNETKQNQLVISNGYLWAYLIEEKVHVFSLGDWLFSYSIPSNLSLNKAKEINDNGNIVSIDYPEGFTRTISLEENILRDTSPYAVNYDFDAIFKNSLHFRNDENLPKINKPIYKLKDNEFIREDYPKLKVTQDKNQLKVKCLFTRWRAHISHYATFEQWLQNKPKITTLDKNLNDLYNNSLRSLYKLRMLTSDGEIKAAGYPYFPSLFGRDFAISALGEIYLDPIKVHEEVLVHLKHLGKKIDLIRNEQPGRAVHEFNYDVESLENNYKHFPSWYANDSNALLLITIFRLARIQKDFEILNTHSKEIKLLWDHMLSLDLDQDGLIEYQHFPGQLLLHQTWRDGGDYIKHSDGSRVDYPIAPLHDQLCLVGAMKEISLYQETNDLSAIDIDNVTLNKQIKSLEKKIEDAYWMPEFGSYALALDGQKEQVQVVNSDVCLGYYYEVFKKSNARTQYKALKDRERLLDLVGIRTVSKEHQLYSPEKYQLGAVWPWQLALTIAGVRNYNLDIGPFFNCLKRISQEGSIAEVYAADKDKPIPLSACIEQRWSSAVPWLALIEGILGLTVSYTEDPIVKSLPPHDDIWQISVDDVMINNKLHKLTLFNDGQVELEIKE
ncbi:MAG TPA: amylo-alpha-1,6-glucosidase [Candidatus Bathyarchaeia archaeon]|nr:amylo-alpha-1,6-glucosidase [Candidatus Bathyarchaeia archaeon]